MLRVGHFPNITHAQALVGRALSREGHGWFEPRVGPAVRVEWFVFNAGPTAMEAIFARSLDLAYVGPNPAINAHLRSRGEEIRIVAGACSGGAALVVQPDGRIKTDADFRGKRIATPQFGNTQDMAARAWLLSKGFHLSISGGDVQVVPTPNPDQLTLFQRGDVDAVWTVEPWVSRLLLEGNGKLYLEESDLWPDRRYVTTLLVSSVRLLTTRRDLLKKWIAAHVELTEWIRANPAEAKRLVNDELRRLTGRELPTPVLDSAWQRLALTHDPLRASLLKSAEDAHRLGFLPRKPDLSRIYDLTLLNDVLADKGKEKLP